MNVDLADDCKPLLTHSRLTEVVNLLSVFFISKVINFCFLNICILCIKNKKSTTNIIRLISLFWACKNKKGSVFNITNGFKIKKSIICRSSNNPDRLCK